MDNVYSSPKAELSKETPDIRYAGFWVRFTACLVDSLWMLPLLFVLGLAYYGSAYLTSEELYMGGVDIFIQYILPIFITLAFWIYKAATPGKMALKVKIVDACTFKPASTGQLIVRYFSYYLSMLVFFLGFIWVAFDARKQGWHDKIARTVVIYS